MIILENRETKSATLCNNDLKHLCEYTNVIVSTDDNEEWIKICTLSNGYVLLKTYAKETTILRTDSIFTHNMSFVYNVEESEEVQQEQDEEIPEWVEQDEVEHQEHVEVPDDISD